MRQARYVAHVEIAHSVAFRAVVLDIEHGRFDLDTLDCFIPFCRALGLAVYAKALGPQAEAIQQALDFSTADQADLPGIVAAAKAAGKPWVMPAWTAPERAFARQHAASPIVVGPQYGIIRAGFENLARSLDGGR